MRAILVIGWKSATSAPEGLYCGLDGVKAQEVAKKAQNSGKYHALRRVSNVETMGQHLPVVPEAQAVPVASPEPLTKDKNNEQQ